MKFFSEVTAFLSVISLCAAANTRVETDQVRQREIFQVSHGANVLYANDLSGCTVLAAQWAAVSGSKQAIFVHICQTTLNADASLDTFMNNDDDNVSEGLSVNDRLEILTGIGQPEATFLIVRVDGSGNELFPTNNQRLRTYINTHFHMQVTQQLTYRAVNAEAIATQDPYENPSITITDQ